MQFWLSGVSMGELMDPRPGAVVRCSSPAMLWKCPGMAPMCGDGAWLDNADFPIDWDERDALV